MGGGGGQLETPRRAGLPRSPGQHNLVGECTSSGARLPGMNPGSALYVPCGPDQMALTSLCLSFPIYKTEIVTNQKAKLRGVTVFRLCHSREKQQLVFFKC